MYDPAEAQRKQGKNANDRVRACSRGSDWDLVACGHDVNGCGDGVVSFNLILEKCIS